MHIGWVNVISYPFFTHFAQSFTTLVFSLRAISLY